MIIAWMLYATVLAGFLAVAASLLENGLSALGIPTRWVWSAALLVSIIVPATALVTPTPSVQPLAVETALSTGIDFVKPGVTVGSRGFDGFRFLDPINGLLTAVWLFVTALILATLAWTSWRTKRHASTWQPSRVAGVNIVYSASSGPAVVGCFPGTIVLPRWTRRLGSDRQEMMVMHEQEHIRARDTALILGGLLLVALIPWNAIVWWQFKRLKHAVELDCDRRVLRRGVNRRAYGELLIELTERGQRRLMPATAFATPKPLLSKRITLMMNQTTRKFGLRTFTAIGTAAMFIGIGCTLPTPPDPVDIPERMNAATLNKELPLGILKQQIAEAREGVTISETALARLEAGETTFTWDAVAAERREQLVRSVQTARESYETILSEGKDNVGISQYTARESAQDGGPSIGAKLRGRLTDSVLVYIDGVLINGESTGSTLDETVFGRLSKLNPDQIERIEILKAAAEARSDPDAVTPSVIRIVTKQN